MASRERLIEKIKVLPEDSLKEVAKFLDALEERDKGKIKQKPDLLLEAIGSCQGPSDLAEMHDKYAYE